MMKLLKFIWLLPATVLVWLFYVLPLAIAGEIELEGRVEGEFIWIFINPIDPNSWYDKQWKKWGGWSGPCCYIYKKYPDTVGPEVYLITKTHEIAHCKDQFNWGVFFYPAYGLNVLWILVSNLWKKPEDRRHTHLDNYFERKARSAAGQVMNIPQNEWPDGKSDYFPWL